MRVIDISERKNREKQIKKQNEQLRKILWIQSHRTRQPVASILGLIHILDKKSLTEDNQKIFQMLQVEADKLDNVIRETVIRTNSIVK
ncbi:MAG: histidine kinase dimerization/phospho-acceptor domain-containing protein [Chryseolinea sp.]